MLKIVVVLDMLQKLRKIANVPGVYVASCSTPIAPAYQNSLLQDKSMEYIKPTLELMQTRVAAFNHLDALTTSLIDSFDRFNYWRECLPYLKTYVTNLDSLKPLLTVSEDWFVGKIFPRTKNVRDFYRVVVYLYEAAATSDVQRFSKREFHTLLNFLKVLLKDITSHLSFISSDLRKTSLRVPRQSGPLYYNLSAPVYLNVAAY